MCSWEESTEVLHSLAEAYALEFRGDNRESNKDTTEEIIDKFKSL